jgi:hypothetical protein
MHGAKRGKSVEMTSKPYLSQKDKLVALHDLDCPWRPRDLEQRLGRIERQGNKNPEVEVFRYVTEHTFDLL